MISVTTQYCSGRSSVISTPSPVREGISYLDATKTFIPPFSHQESTPTAEDRTQNSVNDDTKPDIATGMEPSVSIGVTKLADAMNKTAIVKMTFVIFLSCIMQMTRKNTPIVVPVIIGLCLVALVQGMDVSSRIISAAGLRCIQRFFSLLFPELFPESFSDNLIMLVVVFIMLSSIVQAVDQFIRQQRKLDEEIRRQAEEERRLSEQQLRAQGLRKVWQEWKKRRREKETWRLSQQMMHRQQEIDRSRRIRRCSSANNHDDRKRQYTTQDEAEEVIDRMRHQGADPDDTLRSYYNLDYGRWFVGNTSLTSSI